MTSEYEIMNEFLFSRCLNDWSDLLNMLGSFAWGATSSVVAQNRPKNFSNVWCLIAILHYIEAEFDHGYFITFLFCGSKILHKKFQVTLSKNEGVTLIFPIPNEIKIRKNRRHAFIFGRNDLKFFV